jgi:predicted nucleotidyltransferase
MRLALSMQIFNNDIKIRSIDSNLRSIIMSSFAALFPSPVLVDVLCLFLMHPEEAYYQRSLAEKTGHSLAQVQYALERIEEAGLVSKKKSGNRLYYRAERSHPAFEDLKRAFLKTVALGDVVREALKPLEKKIQFAFVYGSIATGQDRPDSDIDLLLIGSVTLKEISGPVADLSDTLKREVNPVNYTQATFVGRLKEGNRFAQELLETPKIWLIGNEDEFARLAGREQNKPA